MIKLLLAYSSIIKPIEKPNFRLNGFTLFILFGLISALTQFIYSYSALFAAIPFLVSLILIFNLLLKGNINDLTFFLIFVSLMRIIIPYNNREFSIFLPFLLGITILIKKLPVAEKINKSFLSIPLFLYLIYFAFTLFTFFHGLQLPGLEQNQNTGFLSRWNLINSGILFFSLMIGFNKAFINYFLDKLYRFYLFIIFISIVMLVFNINELPLFNSFTWSIIVESITSRKMIIAGSVAVILAGFIISFKRISWINVTLLVFLLIICFISGSRSAFLSFVLVLYFGYFIASQKLVKGIVILFLGATLISAVLLSPVVLMVPEKYQRLVTIFPSRFYTGDLAVLRKSAAASSSDFRSDIWGAAIPAIIDHPVLGNGIDKPKAHYDLSSPGLSAFQKIDSKILTHDFMVTGSLHNTYLSISYLFGIPAALSFIGFLLFSLNKTYRLSKMTIGIDRNINIFFSLLILNYIIQGFVSDLHFNLEFYTLMAIISKFIATTSKPHLS